jgi:hypothetical protein
MSALSWLILGGGIGLQVCLVGRLAWKGLWRQYPWFSSCICWTVARTLLFFFIQARQHPAVYWATDAVDVFARFLIIWEVARHLSPEMSLANFFSPRRPHVFLTATLTLAICVVWSYQTYGRSLSVWTALERSMSFVQALMMLGMLLACRYYEIPLAQQLRTVAVAFGAWASIATVNNAIVDVDHAFLHYWQLIRPLSYVGLLCVWNWAIWMQASVPEQTGFIGPAPDWSEWVEHWDRTRSAMRREKTL